MLKNQALSKRSIVVNSVFLFSLFCYYSRLDSCPVTDIKWVLSHIFYTPKCDCRERGKTFLLNILIHWIHVTSKLLSPSRLRLYYSIGLYFIYYVLLLLVYHADFTLYIMVCCKFILDVDEDNMFPFVWIKCIKWSLSYFDLYLSRFSVSIYRNKNQF